MELRRQRNMHKRRLLRQSPKPNGTPADESYLIHQPNVGPTNWSASGLAPSSPYSVVIYGYSYSCQKYSPFQGETTFTTTDGSDDPGPGTPTPMEILLGMFGTRPTKPADVEVTTSSDGTQATITWSQGDTDNQCPSTLYFVRLYEVGGQRIAQSDYIPQPQTGNPTWNVSDLKPDTQYLIAVYAYGQSCDSFAIHPTRTTFTTTQ